MKSIRRIQKNNLMLLIPFLALFVNAPVKAQGVDRSGPPELGPPPELRLPPIQHLKLSNGLAVVLMEKHEVPLVEVQVLVRTGTAMDPEEKRGLADMTASMLDEGAGGRTALELADAIDYLGASVWVGADEHVTVASLHTPLSKLDSGLVLLADVVMKPSFPREELDRLKKERLTTLLQWHDEPRTIATVLFRRLLYGPRHPYGTPSIGDEKSIQSLTVNDLKRFHDLHFRPKNAVVVIVGDVAPDVIVAKLERVMAEWKGATTTSMNWQKIEQVSNRKIFLVDKPGAAQTEIRIGRIGVERTTPDYYPIVVMNTMLGGSFTSRLNQNLREQHGYTYGAGSVFDMRPLPGPFFAASAVQTEVTDSALIEFMKELKGVRAPASDEEILRAKNFLALGYAEGFQSVGQIAAQLQEVVQYGLPDSYFNTYVRKTLQVTNDDVLQAARAYVDPDRVVIVLVGDRKKIEKGVRALKLGEIEFLKVEDVLGKPPKL